MVLTIRLCLAASTMPSCLHTLLECLSGSVHLFIQCDIMWEPKISTYYIVSFTMCKMPLVIVVTLLIKSIFFRLLTICTVWWEWCFLVDTSAERIFEVSNMKLMTAITSQFISDLQDIVEANTHLRYYLCMHGIFSMPSVLITVGWASGRTSGL